MAQRSAKRPRRDAEKDRLRQQVEQLRNQNRELRREAQEAQRASKRQAAPFRRRKRVLEPKPPGRKKGHVAAHRAAPEQVDREVRVPLVACPCCSGTDLTDVNELSPQVVVDLPPRIELEAVRYYNESGYCGSCRRRVRSKDPNQLSTANGAAGVQIGPRALALSVDLRHRVGAPYRKIVEIFLLVFGLKVSAGGLCRAHQRIADRCLPTYHALVEIVRRAPVVHVDETGWHIANASKRAWLWVFACVEPRITVFAIRFSRGKEVVNEILGSTFAGILAVDGWGAYVGLDCLKGQCSAHLLRRCAELLHVQKGNARRFPRMIKEILLTGMVLKANVHLLTPRRYEAFRDKLVDVLSHVIAGRLTDPDNRRFQRHLRKHEAELLRYLDVPALPPTNNFGEQEIRPAVITRKISAGNRTQAGAFAHAILSTISRTTKRNGLELAACLPALLCSGDEEAVLRPLLAALTAPEG